MLQNARLRGRISLSNGRRCAARAAHVCNHDFNLAHSRVIYRSSTPPVRRGPSPKEPQPARRARRSKGDHHTIIAAGGIEGTLTIFAVSLLVRV